MRFGEELRERRERLGISLNDVAVSTRVSMRHLAALEEDRFTELPGGVFSRGIVRSYAMHCGLDADSAVQDFLNALRARGLQAESNDNDWVELAEAVHRSRPITITPRSARWLGVVAMLLTVVALAVGVLWILQSRGFLHLPPAAELWHHALHTR